MDNKGEKTPTYPVENGDPKEIPRPPFEKRATPTEPERVRPQPGERVPGTEPERR